MPKRDADKHEVDDRQDEEAVSVRERDLRNARSLDDRGHERRPLCLVRSSRRLVLLLVPQAMQLAPGSVADAMVSRDSGRDALAALWGFNHASTIERVVENKISGGAPFEWVGRGRGRDRLRRGCGLGQRVNFFFLRGVDRGLAGR